MKLIRRDLTPGEHVIVHRAGVTYAGVLVRRSRRYITLIEHRMEADGAMRRLLSERLLIPADGAVIEVGRA